jgi:predicted protein tyrosine phosphatase
MKRIQVGAETVIGSRARTLVRPIPPWTVRIASPEGDEPEIALSTRRLDLRFHDVTAPRTELRPPSREAVRALLAFAASWPEEADVVISCFAGVSRSPAAAFVVACAMSAPGLEAQLARALRDAAPSATPNALIVAEADRLLGRDGRMIAANAEIGRGRDAFQGEGFTVEIYGEDVHIRADAASSASASQICSTAPRISPV